ncbi:hypothetical protein R3W88_004182 [Solanum pinnatisectum]|uniref:Uncharacterized protein n=1 Tax=Solanum pinnatisectum TaxID=50273 RepID=A0AAV9KAN0_9SOLN|nr:hypothetical protein R3W88_004182 [Solanum pinnatisectum]
MGTLKECEEHTIQHFHGHMHRPWKYRSHVSKRNLIVLNPLFHNKPPRCCTIKHVPLVRKSGRDSADDEHCYACSSDEEIMHFVY